MIEILNRLDTHILESIKALEDLRAFNVVLAIQKIQSAANELEESNKRIASVTEELKLAYIQETGNELTDEAFRAHVLGTYHKDKKVLALIERVTSNKKKLVELKNLAANEVENTQAFVSKLIKDTEAEA